MIEVQALNYVIQNKDNLFFMMNSIDDKLFITYKDEFNFINEHIKKYHVTPDMVTMTTKFPKFPVVETNETPEYIVTSLFNEYNAQLVINSYKDVIDKFKNKDISGGIEDASNIGKKILENNPIKSVDILNDTTRYENYIEKTKDLGAYYVTTGFAELDKILGGGWDRKEELATIVARPGVGKSWVLLKCAIEAAKKGLRVGLYSGEMSEIKVGYRADTLIGNISNIDISHGNIDIQADYKNYIDSLPDLVSGNLCVLTPEMNNHRLATVSDLQAFIERDKLDMLCVDQHSLLADERHGRDNITKASNISLDLKTLQVTSSIPIISVSQQNRNSSDDDELALDVSRIAQSDRIGQDSTIVLFLQHDHDSNILTITMSKVRDATTGKKLKYDVDLNKGIFTYIPFSEDANNESNSEACDDLQSQFDIGSEEPIKLGGGEIF